MSPRRGFTLIELLVVIAIIGLISSIVLASVNSARAKSRDARRMSDLTQIRTALELYYDANGTYPPSGSCGYDCNGYSTSYNTSDWDALASQLRPYLPQLPKDPRNGTCPPWGNNCYSYAYGNVGRTTFQAQYDLIARFEAQQPQRCAIRQYRFRFNMGVLCGSSPGFGTTADPTFDVSPN